MNGKVKGISIKWLRLDREFIILTLLLILVIWTTSFRTPGLLDYVGMASAILLIVAIGFKLVANWYINKDL